MALSGFNALSSAAYSLALVKSVKPRRGDPQCKTVTLRPPLITPNEHITGPQVLGSGGPGRLRKQFMAILLLMFIFMTALWPSVSQEKHGFCGSSSQLSINVLGIIFII